MTKEGNEIKSYVVIDTADSPWDCIWDCIWIFICTFSAAWVKKMKIVLSIKIVVYIYIYGSLEKLPTLEEVRKVLWRWHLNWILKDE